MKKILIITQVVDRTHPILGFFHRWIEEFTVHCDTVHVIALQVGEYDLPPQVTVHSLGKEAGVGRITYLWRFYRQIYQLRHEYDGVFVHMNQIYVILGGLLWRLWAKRIGLWYAHGAVSISLRLATLLTHMVFTSTPQGFRLDSSKKVVTGQGIDMSRFVFCERPPATDCLELITVGRVSVSKQLETLIRACGLLRRAGTVFRLRIVGAAVTADDHVYEESLRALCLAEGVTESVLWHGAATQTDLPQLLAAADIFIHDGATNSLDKVLVEAVASGVPTISSNPSYRYMLGEAVMAPVYFTAGDAAMLAKQIDSYRALSLFDKNAFTLAVAQKVRNEHSLPNLVSGIVNKY